MKLFRKIRQAFFLKGNFRKYLLYAIGEILLVMIGILLAFQVNTWNDNRVKKDTEIGFYKNIKNQIIDDKNEIKGQMNYNTNFMSQFKYANEIIEANDRTKMDTLGFIVRNLTQYSDFDKQGNIYETMVNSGEIKLLNNQAIINSIRQLEEEYIYINRMENIHYDAMMTYVVSSITSYVKFSNGKIQKPDEIYSFKFQNLILSLIQVMEEKDNVYKDAIVKIDNLTEMIDAELE